MRAGFGLLHGVSVREAMSLAQYAERLGYDSFWFPEHNFSRDAISAMAATAATTQSMAIGACVVPILTRSPLLLATTFATLDELAGGRILLGLGAGSRTLIE